MLPAVVAALIVAGVIAFVAIDAYIFYRVFAGRRSAGEYGAIAVPGQTTLTLPIGKVKLSYQEAYKASGGEGQIDFDVPSALEVSVVSPTGESLDIQGPGLKGMGSVVDTGRNWSRARVGTVQVAQPGDYTITARGDIQGAIEPRVMIGK